MISAIQETEAVWNGIPKERRSRSLALQKLVHFSDGMLPKAEARRQSCEAAIAARAGWDKGEDWLKFLRSNLKLKTEDLLFARLESRLMIDMAGGVIENGNLAIDRHAGIPAISGSAIKGSARRTALREIYEMAGDRQTDDRDVLNAMTDVALIFGWTQAEWMEGRNRHDEFVSDFAWACGERWPAIARDLEEELRVRLPGADGRAGELRRAFAGSVAFLPAYPLYSVREDLELDVLTSHHAKYYRGDRGFETAPDTEDPNPVIFPAVAPGQTFVFAVVTCRSGGSSLTRKARHWLAKGLALYGLGAKTAAGYGWFATDDNIQAEALARIARKESAEKRRAEEVARAEAEVQKGKERQEQRARLAEMSPDERMAFELGQLSADQFRTKLDNFEKLAEEEREGIVRALAGERSHFWGLTKETAQSGPAKKRKRARILEQELRKVSKKLGGILK